MSEYSEVIQGILDSLDEVDDKYKTIGDSSTTLCDINNTVIQIPDSSVIRNVGGDVVGYDYKYTTPKLPNTGIMGIDSNTDSGMYATGGGGSSGGGGAGRGRHSTGKYAGTINIDSQSTDKMNGSGLVSGYISPIWAGVSTLAKLGKTVASNTADALDQLGINFGLNFGPLSVEFNGASAIRTLFGVDSNGNTTMYMDEDTIGALALSAKDIGFFATGYRTANIDPAIYSPSWAAQPPYIVNDALAFTFQANGGGYDFGFSFNGNVDYLLIFVSDPINANFNCAAFSREPFSRTLTYYAKDAAHTPSGTQVRNASSYVTDVSRNTIYALNYGFSGVVWDSDFTTIPSGRNSYSSYTINLTQLATVLYDGVISGGEFLPGVSNQTGAVIPVDAITGADPHVVAQNLVTNYPAVMGTPIQIVVMDDSCNEKTINYYSVPISYSPTNVSINTPITGGLQVNPSFNPDVSIGLPDININNFTEQIINQLGGSGAGRDIVITEPDPITGTDTIVTLPTTPPATGTGNTPEWTPDAEVGSSIMWQVYYVTSAQLQAFGRWLWISSNIVTDMKRIVANPMDAIFGLHKVYTTPTYGSATTIVLGNVDSEVSALPVTNQYKSIVCGSVWITEYFGNIYDYSPYTEISIYLPFIGIVPLSVDDIMRGEIAVDYTVDVYTGACIAEIMVYRDGVGGVLYQFNGNCAVEYPITAMSYNNSIMSLIGISSGIAGAIPQIMAGNPVGAGVALTSSLVHSALQNREITQRSGSFSGNAGAMGSKKPYLIITRPQPEIANDYGDIEGYGANATVEIGQCEGFIQCRTVDLEISGAYKQELNEIEQLLKTGVYI